MGNSLPAKLIYYWIFVLGGLTIAFLLKISTDGKDMIVLLIALTLVYWGMEFMRFRGRQKRASQTSTSGNVQGRSSKKR